MSLKTKQQINKDYYMSKKDSLIQCHECCMPIKYQSYKAHLKTDKHIANCKKVKATYLDTLKASVAKMVDGCNIEAVSKEIYYIIQQEYFLGQAAAASQSKEAKQAAVKISTDQERAEELHKEVMAIYDERWVVLDDNRNFEVRKETQHKDVIRINERYQKIEEGINKEHNVFRSYDIFKKDAIDYMTRVKVCLLAQIEKMKAKMVDVEDEKEQEMDEEMEEEISVPTVAAAPAVAVKVIGGFEDNEEDEDEEEQEDEEEEEDDYGNDSFSIDETDFTTAHFPALYEFRDLKKTKQEVVLEEIAVNCPHVFCDNKRVVIERIYEALSARDKLQYVILYDDIYAFYQNYKAMVLSQTMCDSSAQSDEEQEMFEYDFKY